MPEEYIVSGFDRKGIDESNEIKDNNDLINESYRVLDYREFRVGLFLIPGYMTMLKSIWLLKKSMATEGVV